MGTTGKQLKSSSYIAKTLQPNENLLYYTGLHWMIFIDWPFFWIFVGLIIAFLFDPFMSTPFYFLSLLSLVFSIINYNVSEFAVTDVRVIIKLGFIEREASEIYYSKVESVYVIQGLLGRILNYGSVIVTGIGGSKNVYKNVQKPLELKKIIQEIVNKAA
jgi:uncharacterized membrane protein YdbT with pleckstrin-like domain